MGGPRSGIAARIGLTLISVFVVSTLGFSVVIAALMIAQPKFPLNLGLVATTGRAGLLVIVPPALASAAGLLLLRRRPRASAVLLGIYAIFWALVFLGGLPQVWNARRSFCLNALGFCIYSPWVARLTVLAIVTPFLLVAWWSVHRARFPQGRAGHLGPS